VIRFVDADPVKTVFVGPTQDKGARIKSAREAVATPKPAKPAKAAKAARKAKRKP
jgi:hypothetical protein